MPHAGRFRFRTASGRRLMLALAAGGLLAMFIYATATGLSGTSDSRYYLFAAQSWRTSGRLLHLDGTAYRYWAPLYPLLLSWAGTTACLRALHGAALVATLLLWAAVGRLLLPARRAAAVPLLLAFSAPALVLSRFVWAETGLALLWAGFVWALLRWWRQGCWGAFWLSAALGFMLPLQHNTGIFLLLGIGAALQLEQPAAGAPARWVRLLHTFLTLAGALLWQGYLLTLSLPAHSYANLGGGQLLSSLADYGFVLLRWLLPLPAGWRTAGPAGGWALGLLGLLAALWPRRGGVGNVGAGPRGPGEPDQAAARAAFRWAARRGLWLAAAASMLLLLLATLVRRAGAGVYEAERYGAVLYPVVVVLVLASWPAADHAPARRLGPRWWRWLSRAVLAAWLLYAGLRALHNARQLRQLPPMPAWQLRQGGRD